MQAKLKTMSNYTTIRNDFMVFDLLKEIKGHTFRLTDRDYPYQSVWDSYINVFSTKQGSNEFLDRFQERFNIMVEAAEGYGSVFGSEEVLWETDDTWKVLTDSEKQQAIEIEGVKARCRERLLAYGFTSALSNRFDAFKKGLQADYSQGNNNYKETVVESYQMQHQHKWRCGTYKNDGSPTRIWKCLASPIRHNQHTITSQCAV